MRIKTLLSMMLIASAPITGMAQGQAGIKAENLDKSVRPADDFFTFATGGWQKLNPLPAAFSRFGSFDQLQENNNKRINTILTDLLKKQGKEGSVEWKLGNFYKLAMDSVRRNKEGVSPVKPLIDEMEGARTLNDLRALQLKYASFGYGIPFEYGFDADEKNAKMNILNISQGGLSLGQKEYYLDNDKATSDIRKAYCQFIADMFRLYGFSDAQAQAKRDAIMRYETMLALLSKSRTELRDVEANYNKMTLGEFKTNYPNIPLEQLANAEGIKSEYIQSMVVGQPAFLAGVDKLAATSNADELRARMEGDVILSSANYFPASSKKRMEELVKNLQVSLAERIKAQDWMSEATKKAALEKLSTFYVKVGYPNKWKDLSKLTIDPKKSYYENVQNCKKFWAEDAIKEKAGKPVDKDQWLMTPQTVNAYYNPTTNEICFPAGILQYPFFDPKADDAFNYGAIGVVIGHEMTHGFDDQGRHYDKDGNMTDWWTAEDGKNFEARTGKYADFFSAIKVLPDLYANGKLTLGENLADHGGLEVAFNAFMKTPEAKAGKTIMGFTPEQRFFIAYAGVWANNITEAEIRSRVKSDPHSLGEWRVNGALPHINAWYKAFGVKEGDKLFIPESKRLKLW